MNARIIHANQRLYVPTQWEPTNVDVPLELLLTSMESAGPLISASVTMIAHPLPHATVVSARILVRYQDLVVQMLSVHQSIILQCVLVLQELRVTQM